MNNLTNKRVLVTGASSGFGRAIALACAAEGAHVALVARRQGRLEELANLIVAKGQKAVVCQADVGIESEIAAALQKAKAELGVIDILVNNAGTNMRSRRISDTTSDEWRNLINVNLTSAFLFTKAVLADMIEQASGTIINIASKAASSPSIKAGVAYSSAKRGIEALTKVTNEEANPYNVRACVINPGEANTPIMDLRPEPPSQERREQMIQAEDIAKTVVLVASLPKRVTIDLVEMRPTRQ